jgi:hypothetical protein
MKTHTTFFGRPYRITLPDHHVFPDIGATKNIISFDEVRSMCQKIEGVTDWLIFQVENEVLSDGSLRGFSLTIVESTFALKDAARRSMEADDMPCP